MKDFFKKYPKKYGRCCFYEEYYMQMQRKIYKNRENINEKYEFDN